MPRYIDADAIHYVEIGKGVEIALASDIDKIPTVSPDEVRGVGKWIKCGPCSMVKCSVCNGREYENEATPYCPNCGAKMEVTRDA